MCGMDQGQICRRLVGTLGGEQNFACWFDLLQGRTIRRGFCESALLWELFGDIVVSVRIHTHNLTQDVVEKKKKDSS